MSWFTAKAKKLATVTCADVVTAFGATLEEVGAKNEQLHDAAELPFDKPLIEAALLQTAYEANTSVPEDTLKAGYMELATFSESGAGVSLEVGKNAPKSRAEMAAFMKETGPKLERQRDEAEYLLRETRRRSFEWDQRLAAMRNQADA